MLDVAARRRLAGDVLGSLDGLPAHVLRLLGRALEVDGDVLAGLGTVLDMAADAVEDEEVTGDLAEIRLAFWLREAVRDDELVARLAALAPGEPPWSQLAAAVVAAREAA